jgi:hypothetical protein
MPGYRSLSSHLSGSAADHAREAELHQRSGDSDAAARLLEEALEASVRARPEMPGWICGRLASIYRTLKRYDDEVLLLERYRESQTSEDARTRFDARLSKARAIAHRKRRPETGALATVRQVRDRSSQRRRSTPGGMRAIGDSASRFSAAHLAELRAAFVDTSESSAIRMRAALTALSKDAKETNVPMEALVAELKSCWIETAAPASMSEDEWHERYANSLVELLAFYFEEQA